MTIMDAPIFYDASGRRRRWSMRGVSGLLLLAVGAALSGLWVGWGKLERSGSVGTAAIGNGRLEYAG